MFCAHLENLGPGEDILAFGHAEGKLGDICVHMIWLELNLNKFWLLNCASNVGSSKSKRQYIWLVQEYIYLCILLSFYLQIYKTGMITMLSNSLIQQHNMNWLTCYITIKVVSADSSWSVVWWGARAACAEVARGVYGLLKAQQSPGVYGLLESVTYIYLLWTWRF
jgi:hypothetical protein